MWNWVKKWLLLEKAHCPSCKRYVHKFCIYDFGECDFCLLEKYEEGGF